MNKLLITLCCVSIALKAASQKTSSCQFTIDLINVKDDKVRVVLNAPAITQNEITYYIPKIVPGTYSEDDFGRFIEDFSAVDKKGVPLTVEKINTNSWKIHNAKNLFKIMYKVNDSFDDFESPQPVFEPCGSNIQKDTNYLINNHCFIGYFDDMKKIPYKLTVLHPQHLYGSSPLTDLDGSAVKDKFEVESYNRIVDNPIMYSIPDTTSITVGSSQVVISVYSPGKKVSSAFLAENFNRLLQAQAKYLGGTLPVSKYVFLVYLFDKPGVSGANGALEHSYSSVYYMPEGDPKIILQNFLDVAAHEFFHIVTPLNLHSEEIAYFDFNEPKMSEHLWLYEGSTEYHAHLAQERYGLISKDDFLKVIGQKITISRQRFNDSLVFTVMSANVLHQYAAQFGNVYQKGALIAMCLDIKLRKLSNGKKGIIDLILELSEKYGKNKPFKDVELFDQIGKISYPEIKDFLETYVAGSKPLPLSEVLAEAGVELTPVVETKDSVFTLGSISITRDPETKKIHISDLSKANEFGKGMGYQLNDELQSINGQDVNSDNYNKIVSDLYNSAKTGDLLIIVVNRKNQSGTDEKISLSAPMMKVPVMKYNQLSFKPDPTPEQQALQNNWLNAG